MVRTETLTSVLEWLGGLLAAGLPKTSVRLYFDLLDAMFSAAVTDLIITDNPYAGVKLAQVLRGMS